ncbi:stress-activated map kinase-interacting protein 1 isoform X2 [Pectinophora gossypiella]|uniref:stress-activated map kinase-interacting protein 1 isoform X2 n=1 Tax=Pectinophora gossypiella TaxID=13191 RepID=UPI00214F13A0|nr:stress-activated map kinase-interacting protein 1 isoform X2 [Pectinophora gossypiella]
MATYDNKIWLLKNIRDAFIATDDTGLCEIVMTGRDFSKIFRSQTKSGDGDHIKTKSDDEEERDMVTEFDPYPDMEDSEDDDISYGSYIPVDEGPRLGTDRAQWLDKKEQALKKAAKIKVVKWEDPAETTTEEVTDLFSKVEVKKPEKLKSLLSEQLEKCPELPHRQYLEYAKFDGTAQLGLPTKSFKIFMTMLPEKHQNYPLVVCVIANAKIKDLIGFTCYKYSIEHPEIQLGSVHDYGLCIAEDDGEVDWAFPCLDSNEPCSKFGFTCLGLVELKNKNIMGGTSGGFSIPEDDGFRMFRDVAFSGFPKAIDSGQSVQNTSRHNTGGSATSEAVLKALKAVNEERKGRGDSDFDKIQSHIMAAEAPQYKTYRVQMLRKVRTNTPVQLGISLERIEVEPQIPHKHAFWSRSKYFLHSIDSVAWCQILESKANKSTFRIVYSTSHNTSFSSSIGGNTNFFHPNSAYKAHDFECDHDTAKEIVEKVNTILDLRNSPCRREYKTAKEKKLQSRRSFHTKHLS